MTNLLQALSAFALGFFVPGYLLARICRLRGTILIFSAFPFSLICLFNICLAFQLYGIMINYTSIMTGIMAVSIVLVIIMKFRNIQFIPKLNPRWLKPSPASYLAAAPIAISVMLIAIRAVRQPMMSPDSLFRWNHLAIMIMQKGHFSFYPPANIADYMLYASPDGFPPLVSISYFWLYCGLGKVLPTITATLVCLQYICCLFFVYRTAAIIFKSRKCAYWACLVFATCPLVFFSFLLGQETGYTALSVAMTVYFIHRAANLPAGTMRWPDIIPAAFAAALAALCREYGAVIIAVGAVFAWREKIPGRQILIFLISSSLLAAPFYLRNLVLYGNPLFPLPFFGFLNANESYAGLLRTFNDVWGVGKYPGQLALNSLKLIAVLAPLPVIGSIITIKTFFRQSIPSVDEQASFGASTVQKKNSRMRHPAICNKDGIHPVQQDAGHSAMRLLTMSPKNGSVSSMTSSTRSYTHVAKFANFIATPQFISVTILFAVWLYSVGFTCGGLFYSMRVLSPAIAIMSVFAGYTFAKASEYIRNKAVLYTVSALAYSWFLILQMLTPNSPWQIPPRYWHRAAFDNIDSFGKRIFKYLEYIPADSIVLSDSGFYHAVAVGAENQANSQLVPVWTPELRFLFSREISYEKQLDVLKEMNISYVMKTKDSVNNQFLEKHRFFREYPKHCPIVVEGPDSIIYALHECID